MRRIQVLPPGLVNQIAAGEVVERPASVVKELVENALDAGARNVSIDVEEGGLALVRVADDGSGMNRGDAVLAIERHATSKLHDAEGLTAIRTLGFRGEALPAMASVSRFRLDTAPDGDGAGSRVEIEGGAAPEVSDVARAKGTTVEVRDLFFNTPARRKFMRSASTETGHVTEAVVRLSLACQDAGFTVRSGGRVLIGSPAGASLSERAALALGRGARRHLVPVDATRGDVRVHGFVCSPEFSEATGRAVYLIVNGRWVRDRGAAHAVLRAFAGTLPAGRHPAGVLLVDLPPERVDVNVHPQKYEVRFAEARATYDAVFHAVAAALRTAPWLGRERGSERVAEPGSSGCPPSMAAEEVADVLWRGRDARPPDASGAALELRPDESRLPLEGVGRSRGYFASLRYVGQHARTYLLCEGPEGALVVVDQHASHERLLFHRLREAFRARTVAAQPFLVPQIVSLPAAAARALEAGVSELGQLGLDVEPFGGDSFAVKGAPAALGGVDLQELLGDLASQLADVERASAVDEALHGLLATMACHSAIRANQEVSAEEARALLDGLDAVDFKARCPHGRPVVFEVSLGELERRVGRR